MLKPFRPSLLLKAGWVCSVGTRISEVFEMLVIAHVPHITIPSFPYTLQRNLSCALPSAYAQILPVFCEKPISSESAPAKHMAFKKCLDMRE